MEKFSKAVAISGLAALAACSEADIASSNVSKAADNFEVERRVTFYNGITGQSFLVIQGLCSLGNNESNARQRTVTCKTGPKEYKKHFLGLSDNVTYFAEQIEPSKVSGYHYRVFWNPQAIIPDVDVRGDARELRDAVTPGGGRR